ncbi:23S rRNA G2445 N2-methylase RlmL [Seinonella peptonophila]|uniref:23S rRNA G2445 N2-methylase RlmL n=1 Tax=Seinonella peptonophila TaxID=112248 RepID=A0A1M4U403_9BACL|nr:methyltransferase domain-containing protein [Seinonella peptonophila]SHE51277.1 23S rRNA G2445 N2-methylase RlmL [Seinonella peptonophila]
MNIYFASVLPGLEMILVDEISKKINPVKIVNVNRGKVFFYTNQSTKVLFTLRTANDLFQVIDQTEIGSHKKHLLDVEKWVSNLDFSLFRGEKTFRVNASRKGKQTYSRFDLADAAMKGIQKKNPRWKIGAPENHQIEFRLDLENELATFSLRLTKADFRFRTKKRDFMPAALLPTVAHAMVWLSQPQSTDLVVDPCCGSGTLLAERLDYPVRQMFGGDISTKSIQVARRNLGNRKVKLSVWDIRKLPLVEGSIDTIISNLPFGKQIETREKMEEFLRKAMIEMSRVLKAGGKAILLTTNPEQILLLAKSLSLSCDQTYLLSLKGLLPTLVVLKKDKEA